MTETSGFMDPGSYDAATFAAFVSAVMGDGYRKGYLNELAVTQQTPTAMAVNVATGGAFVQGCWYKNDSVLVHSIDAADASLNRIDRIVLEKDATTDISCNYVKGTFAASPTAPALTQTPGGTWQISLCQILVAAGTTAITTAMITDERLTSYCGPAGAKLGPFSIDTSGNLYGGLSTFRITGIADPSGNQDAATKNYIDSNFVTADSPTLTGTPLITNTPAVSDDSHKIADTAFVKDVFATFRNTGTYDGDNSQNRPIAHGLGVVPKFVLITTDVTGEQILTVGPHTLTNLTYAGNTSTFITVTDATDTYFYVGGPAAAYSGNKTGGTYYWIAFG